MKGVIVQKVEIFDPSGLTDYIDAVETHFHLSFLKTGPEILRKGIELAYQNEKEMELYNEFWHVKLPPIEERDRHIDGTVMGTLLYPNTISCLNPLNISQVSDLRYITPDGEVAGNERNVKTLDDLLANVEKMAKYWPIFKAIANPPVDIGLSEVMIEMHYSYTDEITARRREGRSVVISGMYDDPNAARIGLRKLKEIFPEAVFNEELFILPSEEVRTAYEKSMKYDNSVFRKWWAGEATDEEKAVRDTLNRGSRSKLLRFAMPYLQKLGIIPIRIGYGKDFPTETFDAILSFIESPEYKNPSSPDVHARFDGREITLHFTPGKNMAFDIKPFDYAVRIENKDREGTLEDILLHYKSLGQDNASS